MTDYVRLALARMMGIRLIHIGHWTVSCGAESISFTNGFAPGLLKASLRVAIHPEAHRQVARFRDSGSGSIYVQDVMVDMRRNYAPPIEIDVHLLYGKETQHFFKALAQQFTVRGKKSKRGSK